MELLVNAIAVTSILLGAVSWFLFSSAWHLGGEFYIYSYYGRRKNWIERLLDGFEVLHKM